MGEHKQKQGFTIIEVVLVLAIAGLIFIMVFIALPALRRSQRDRERGNDVAEIAAMMQNYRTHNNGRLPGTAKVGRNAGRACFMDGGSCDTLGELNDFLKRYASNFIDPTTAKPYRFVAAGINGSSCKEQVDKMSRGGNLFNSYSHSGLVMCYETKCDQTGVYGKNENRNGGALFYHQEMGGMVCDEI